MRYIDVLTWRKMEVGFAEWVGIILAIGIVILIGTFLLQVACCVARVSRPDFDEALLAEMVVIVSTINLRVIIAWIITSPYISTHLVNNSIAFVIGLTGFFSIGL
jgi:hypothetical protein